MRITENYSFFYTSEDYFKIRTKDQISSQSKSHSRYNSVNFNAYNLYKTVEFRAFAATNKISKFKKSINFLIENVNKYLNQSQFTPLEESYSKLVVKDENAKTIIREIITKEQVQEAIQNVQH
jgi:uncharacterized FlaG/YvyC family protein